MLPKLHFTFNYEHFPESIDGLLNFTESESIYDSNEGFNVPHSVYSDMVHAEIGQYVLALFENNCVDIYSILLNREIWLKDIYFPIYGIFDIN